MHRPFIAVSTAVAVLALAACGHAPQPMPTKPFVREGVTMSLYPPAAPDCKPTSVYVATLSWSVEGLGSPKTEVRITKPDGQSFARSNDRKAKADTGKWVAPGTWFLLFDRKSGDMLGALQAGPKPCP
jgi:hypothetical protein